MCGEGLCKRLLKQGPFMWVTRQIMKWVNAPLHGGVLVLESGSYQELSSSRALSSPNFIHVMLLSHLEHNTDSGKNSEPSGVILKDTGC